MLMVSTPLLLICFLLLRCRVELLLQYGMDQGPTLRGDLKGECYASNIKCNLLL